MFDGLLTPEQQRALLDADTKIATQIRELEAARDGLRRTLAISGVATGSAVIRPTSFDRASRREEILRVLRAAPGELDARAILERGEFDGLQADNVRSALYRLEAERLVTRRKEGDRPSSPTYWTAVTERVDDAA